MKKLVRKGVCLLLIAMMLASLVGCSKIKSILNGDFGGSANSGSALKEASSSKAAKECVFKEIKEIDLGWENINSVYYADGRVFAYSMYTDYEASNKYWEGFDWEEFEANGSDWSVYEEFAAGAPEVVTKFRAVSMNETGDDRKNMEFELTGDNWINGFAPVSADEFCLIYTSYKYDENNPNDSEQHFLKRLNMDGQELSSVKIEKPSGMEYMSINGNMVIDDDRNCIISANGTLMVFSPEGKKIAEAEMTSNQDGYINNLVSAGGGKLICSYYDYSTEKNATKLVDSKTLKVVGDATLPANYGCYNGGANYDIYYTKGDGTLMGYDVVKETSQAIFSPMDSDINPSDIGRMVQVDDTHIIAVGSSRASMYSEEVSSEVKLYEKVNPEDVKDKEIITIGCLYLNWEVSSRVMEFNKNSDEYRFRMISYNDLNTDGEWDKAVKQFNNDIITGNAPDIVFMETNMNIEKYADKGLFKDLNKYFEKDPDINRSDYNEHVLELCSSKDGKLCAITPSYSVNAFYMKKSIIGSDELTMKKLEELESQYNVEHGFWEQTKKQVLNSGIMYGYDAFVDIKKGKCNFDSQAFIDLLNYANKYPDEINWDELYADESYWQRSNLRMRNNECLIDGAYLSNFSDFNYNEQGTAGEEVVLLGFPVEGSSGYYAYANMQIGIMKSCKHDDVAWDFIKLFLQDDYQDTLKWEMPLKNSAMEKKIEEAQKRPYWENPDGTTEEYDQSFWISDGNEIKISPMTEARARELAEFVNKVDKFYYYDQDVLKIVEEEAEPFFAGQKTADEVAKIVQSRVQLYVNENK